MQVPIPDDWDGVSTCRWAVCWPDSIKWKAILYGLLGQPYQGRFWDRNTGNIVDTQQAFYPMYLYNFNLKGVIMSCDDSSIGTALDNIAASIALLANRGGGQGCCNSPQTVINNSIQNTVTQPIGGNDVPVYGSEPPITLPPGEFPEEYPTLNDYLVDKCRIANMIADGFILSIRGLGAFTVFNLTALAGLIGLALASVIIFPPSAIPIMIAAIIALGLEIAILSAWADEIEAHRDELVCILYEADGVEAAIAVLADFLDAMIALINTTGVIGAVIKTIGLLLLNSDTLNQLFSGAAALGYPDADCSSCGCEGFTWDFETDTQGWTNEASCLTEAGAVSFGWFDDSGDGVINFGADNTGGSDAAGVAMSPDLDIPIVAGMTVEVDVQSRVGSVYFRIYMTLAENGCTPFVSGEAGGFPTETTFTVTADLFTGYIGDVINKIEIQASNSIGGNAGMFIREVRVMCPD